jgi:hypothetical protein
MDSEASVIEIYIHRYKNKCDKIYKDGR